MPVSAKLQSAATRSRPVLKIAGKLVLLTALRYGPTGIAGWAVKSVARRPAKMLLALVLEPLLTRVANKYSSRYLQKRGPRTR